MTSDLFYTRDLTLARQRSIIICYTRIGLVS
ncbi:hypothetical protein MED222_05670 [Vibrio sp. MED222]|nr:hypothetical protein MED222_05670 [Vibrio sp. MED222]